MRILVEKKTYAAFMLFQFRTIYGDKQNKKRVCEEKIYHIKSENANTVYKEAIKIGLNEEFSYMDNGKEIFYEFVGIIDIVEMPKEEESNVVWARYIEKVEPMERKDRIIPPMNKLSIFRSKKGKIKV